MFKITQHQYDLIMQQAQSCYPQETGGILGGRDNVISGVLPIFNKQLSNSQQSYGLTSDDIQRGHAFLAKHGLEYLGIYHSHPRGIAYPSSQDLIHKHNYLFIISLLDRYNPELQAFRREKGKVISEGIKIIDNRGITILNLSPSKPKLRDNLMVQQMSDLRKMIDDIVNERIEYPRLKPVKWDASHFSTMA